MRGLALISMVVLAGCMSTVDQPVARAPDQTQAQTQPQGLTAKLAAQRAAKQFVDVVGTVEPVAERECRRRAPGSNCDFQIVVDDRKGMPPNAYQTLDKAGRPVIAFTLAMIAEARNADELAFVMSHETAHHIAGHIRRQEENAAAGAVIERRKMPWLTECAPLIGPLFAGEAWATWGAEIDARPEKLYPPILERFRGGKGITAQAYLNAWTALEALRARWAEEVAAYDAVLMPSVSILPPKVEELMADADFFAAENMLALRNTRLGNMMGVSALTLPTGTPSCGLMLFAPPHGEAALLRLGVAVERALA